MIQLELQTYCIANPEASERLKGAYRGTDGITEILADILATDRRRLEALNPTLLRRVINA